MSGKAKEFIKKYWSFDRRKTENHRVEIVSLKRSFWIKDSKKREWRKISGIETKGVKLSKKKRIVVKKSKNKGIVREEIEWSKVKNKRAWRKIVTVFPRKRKNRERSFWIKGTGKYDKIKVWKTAERAKNRCD